MSTGDASNAFISGQVDAAAIWEPSLSMAQKETGGNILASTKDAEYEGLIPAVLATNGNALKTKREEIKKVMKAIKEADPHAFVNVMKTEQLSGRFYQKPTD